MLFEPITALEHVCLYLMQHLGHAVFRGYEVARRIDVSIFKSFDTVAAYGVKTLDALYLIIPEADAITEVGKRRKDVYGVSLHTEPPVDELYLVAHILGVKQRGEQVVSHQLVAYFDMYGALFEALGIAYAVDATYRADHYHVPASTQQRR